MVLRAPPRAIRVYQSDPRRAQQAGPPPTQPTTPSPQHPDQRKQEIRDATLDKRPSISGVIRQRATVALGTLIGPGASPALVPRRASRAVISTDLLARDRAPVCAAAVIAAVDRARRASPPESEACACVRRRGSRRGADPG